MSIDHNARLDVHDLLARFCQYLDQGRDRDWAELFHCQGSFECVGCGSWRGTEQLAMVPALARGQASGEIRRLVSAVIIDPGATWRDLEVKAYGPVIDLERGGAIAAFYDYSFSLHYVYRWKIRHASANYLGSVSPDIANVQRLAVLAGPQLN